MHAFDVLGDPVRRRILELLADGERSAGEVSSIVQDEFAISQPAASQHLRVLRESGFTSVRPVGTRRLYAVDPLHFKEVDVWLEQFRRLWEESFERLDDVLVKMKKRKKEENHGRKDK
jgi:DNA-binding transcriptional ArsR family regulator